MEINNSWYIVINPVSGNNYYRKNEQELIDVFSKLTSNYQIAITEFVGHEQELVQEAITLGYRKFISVGGDGTLHHVVNGIMKFDTELTRTIKVGVIPIGTGNDWVKHYQIPKNIEKCIAILNQEKTVFQDIGKINSAEKVYYFNNFAGIGFDGHIVKQIQAYRKFGKLAYFLVALSSLFTYRKQEITYSSSTKSDTANVYLFGMGLCTYCGSGMQLTHHPNSTDGLIDISVVKDISALGFLWNIRKMFNQKLHLHPKVDTFKCDKLSISTPKNSTLLMEADGELIPFESAEVSVVGKAILVVVA